MLPLASHAQASEADVDRLVLSHAEKTGTPSFSVAVVQDGRVVFAKGYGLANVETKTSADEATIYRIGSLTKQFTAALVMSLVERGKIALDDPVTKHLKELPKAFEGITIRQLLNHTSGVASYTGSPEFGKRLRESTTPMGILQFAGTLKPDFKPGAAWNYNNTGYVTLGLLVEQLEGKPFSKVLEQRITGPISMSSTRMSDPRRITPKRAAGYTSEKGELTNAAYVNLDWPYAAGAMESTVLDLAKWDVALYTDLIVKQATLQEMWKPTPLPGKPPMPYGFAWAVPTVNGVQIVEHDGAIDGFNGYIGRIPSKRTSVIVLANLDSGDAESLGRQILGTYVPEVKPKAAVAIEDRDPALTAFLKGKLEALLKGELKSEDLTPEFAKILTPQLIQDTKTTLGALGALEQFLLIDSKEASGTTVRTYSVRIGPADLTGTFSVTKDRKISGIVLRAK